MGVRATPFFALVALVSACSGSTATVPDAGGPTGYGGGCPDAAPANNDACTNEAVECEYHGTEKFCGQVFLCSGGKQSFEAGYCGTSDITGTLCASKLADVPVGKSCTSTGVVQCDYGNGRCSCSDLGSDAGLVWHCTSTPTDCPDARPLLGMNCAPEGKKCDYGACLVEDTSFASPLAFRCTAGIWVRAGCE